MQKHPPITEQFGERIRSLRKARDLSQEELADLCELDRTYISGIERGLRNVSLRNIKALANALEVSLSDLFKGI
jgi:transcriptional regulator with XRE-family HTH domain